MSKETLIEKLRGYKSTPRHCEELCFEAAIEIESLRQQLSAAQAKIDELMLEYCPEEMTNEQIAEYEKHQRPAWRNFSLELKK